MKNKLAIFDLDGTLVDSAKVNYYAYRQALEAYGYALSEDYFFTHCNGRHYTLFLPEIMGKDTKDIQSVHTLKQKVYMEHLPQVVVNRKLFDIISLIRPEYHIALVTTASKPNCTDILRYLDRETLFELVITGDDVERTKPDPEGFSAAMRHFGVTAQNTLIFEDSEDGLQAAQSSGAQYMKVYGYNQGSQRQYG
ncbi:HAD family phosphatase [Ruminococcaceae bacterium OttesenSCG-928-I18]|nr:HAD family phosphatase [Ruminococcaceae bacterium OttesenSCG-928-I18]